LQAFGRNRNTENFVELIRNLLINTRSPHSLKNLKAITEAAGTSFDRAVKVTVFVTDMENFARINRVYVQYSNENPPARSAVQVEALPKNAEIEIEAIVSL
jgi:2-iminobutanoate/2-iminopropanoate deaminase